MDRRSFFKSELRQYVTGILESASLLNNAETPDNSTQDYFKSFYSCYPLLSEAPYNLLAEAAQKLGIEIQGKSKLELAKEIFAERR